MGNRKPPITNRTVTGIATQKPGARPVATNKVVGARTNLAAGNRLGRPGLRRASSTGSLATQGMFARSILNGKFSFLIS